MTYRYDVFNQLIVREDATKTTVYVNESGHRLIEFRDYGGAEPSIKRRLYGPGVDQLLAVDGSQGTNATKLVWTLHDHQGTVRTLLGRDSEGEIKSESITYDAFGEPGVSLGSLGTQITTFYAGRDYDNTTDLYYNRARWYDPVGQRFISVDPIGFAAGDTNLYRYCFNSPTNFTDPSGNIAFLPFLLAGLFLESVGTAGVMYANSESDAAMEAGRVNDWMISYDRIDQERFNRAQYIAAGGEAVAFTGLALAGGALLAPGAGAVHGLAAGFSSTLAGVGTVSVLGAGGYLIGSEGVSIYNDWGSMSGPDRLRRLGTLVGTTLAGGIGGAATARSAAARGLYRSAYVAGASARGSVNRFVSSHVAAMSSGVTGSRLYGRLFAGRMGPAHAGMSRGEFLRQKYAHYTPAQRQARIATFREQNAARILQQAEANAHPNAHFYSRHGAHTTVDDQVERSISGLTPDGYQGNPMPGSRFLAHQDQLAAYNRALELYQPNGPQAFGFTMRSVIGEGVEVGGAQYVTTSNVRVAFKGGRVYTMFPRIFPQ